MNTYHKMTEKLTALPFNPGKHPIGTPAAHIVQYIWWDLKYCQKIFLGWTRANEYPKNPISYNLGKLFQKKFYLENGDFFGNP